MAEFLLGLLIGLLAGGYFAFVGFNAVFFGEDDE